MSTDITINPKLSKRLTFKKGDYIFKKGEDRDYAFIVIEGSVVIITTSHTGADAIGSKLSSGDIFGEMALLEPGERTASARATMDTSVYAISREAIKERMSGVDPIIGMLFALLVDRYRKTRIYIPESAELPDPERVVRHLRQLAEQETAHPSSVKDVTGIFENLDSQRKVALDELQQEQRLSDALKQEQIVPWLQPIVSLDNEDIVGYEALARWEKEDGTVLFPPDFIPQAEKNQLIQRIDYAILDKGCAFVKKNGENIDCFVSVNLSGIHFEDPIIIGMVKDIIDDHAIDPKNIKLEVTENILISDPDNAKKTLYALKDLGVSLALDDFGTGYSSLSYLHRFPFDTIKVDRSFVSSLSTEKKSINIIKAIIAMANTFKMNVVAEGIESEMEMIMLRSAGCSMGQGYYFGKPQPIKGLDK